MNDVRPRPGTVWRSVEKLCWDGKRVRVAVFIVTSPFASEVMGPQESQVVCGGETSDGPGVIAYSLSAFLDLYEPDDKEIRLLWRQYLQAKQEQDYDNAGYGTESRTIVGESGGPGPG